MVKKILLLLLIWSLLLAPATADTSSIQPYLDRVQERIKEFSLDNGMKFIVLEDHQAPLISFVTYADVGSVDEPKGKTGVAHFLEHLAFKGTQHIGTTNYRKEKPVLKSLDRLFDKIQAAKAAGKPQNLAKLERKFNQKLAQASKYVQQNQFGRIVETAGGVNLNAATSTDYTIYFYSFPANKLELWMSLESERFLEPVFREFYQEKDVILEERQLRTDNSPIGKMIEEFLNTAFTTHPYKRPTIGYEEDIRNLTREDIKQFFATYYVPSNLTIAIVGDVDPTEVEKLAEIYFGRYSKKPAPPQVTIIEPPQQETKEITLQLPTQPWYLEGYHRPNLNHPDHPVYQIISGILSDGRTSRLYQSLVEEKQIALNAQSFSGFPGDKYPNLVVFYALTAPGHTVEEIKTALDTEIERLKTELVTDQELERVKTQARADLLRTLDSNIGMARLLTEYQAKTGNWRNLFKELDRLSFVSAQDIQRVAQNTFVPQNRTIGRLLPN
ncbi:MAG: insulinase family protein [Prochloron sp. SP5CPC1]|nr:insulinase family protein [Candidatus Paraprochloron terpiosi SP5CPC1]